MDKAKELISTDLDKSKKLMDPTSIWTPVTNHIHVPRVEHRAVLEPVSRRLWLIGGVDAHGDSIADIRLKMPSLNPAPLKLQCLEQGALSIDIGDQRIAGTTLRDEIVAFKSNMCYHYNKDHYEDVICVDIYRP